MVNSLSDFKQSFKNLLIEKQRVHILSQKSKKLSEIEIEYRDLCQQIKHQYSHREILDTKKDALEEARDTIENFNKTVADLKKEKEEIKNDNNFETCSDSQKLTRKLCIEDMKNGDQPGDNFPNNFRQSRRNRSHLRKNNSTVNFRTVEIRAEYLAARNPFSLTQKYFNFEEHHKFEGNTYAKPAWYQDTGQDNKLERVGQGRMYGIIAIYMFWGCSYPPPKPKLREGTKTSIGEVSIFYLFNYC